MQLHAHCRIIGKKKVNNIDTNSFLQASDLSNAVAHVVSVSLYLLVQVDLAALATFSRHLQGFLHNRKRYTSSTSCGLSCHLSDSLGP